MRSIDVLALAIVTMFVGTAPAIAAPPTIVTQGSGGAMACVGCHGADGAGNPQSGIPMLAQLPQAYFVKQIDDFKAGTRENPLMSMIAQAMTAEDAQAAAAYYESLPRPKTKAAAGDPAIIARGEELANNGAWDRDIPPCFRCHGTGGVGVAPVFPPLAGQHASYTISQLKAWKSGARSNDPQSLMKTLAKNLTDDDMQAVAQYLATLTGAQPPRSGAYRSNVAAKGETAAAKPAKFVPPPESAIPKNEFGETVMMGKSIFTNTQNFAKQYVGNGLNCANCHLDNGRKADSAPLWAAYVLYPAYRTKTRQVDTIQTRIQGCFLYSMNGKAPPADSKEMTALVTYHYWLASGAPTGVKLPGQGFVEVAKPPKTPDIARGAEVYKNNCVICHGANGEGTQANGGYAFPPLWGEKSYNWGAGMHRINTAAGFIKMNMPYGRGGTLTDQEAWDVALFMNSNERGADPRFEGSIEQTRDKEHDENCLYGRTPEELAALLEKKAKAKAAPAPAQTRGLSPATAH